MTGRELSYIEQAYQNGQLAGDGPFTKKCHQWLEGSIRCKKALLTHSCTAALEMAAILLDIEQGDEIIMPSYTFVSTANAFVLRGGVPVFVDIREDTLNIDEKLIEDAITPHTKVIVPVHYAGVACEMDTILEIANRYNLMVVEDAAQGLGATYKGRPLGSMGDLGALSFHETKNIISGEGGALLVNNSKLAERAEVIREKGTNRSKFFRGEVDKYTWVDIGSSYLPGEVVAAFLWAQLQESEKINSLRIDLWDRYNDEFDKLEQLNVLKRPVEPTECQHNAHMYYILFPDLNTRAKIINGMKRQGINCAFHYVPLHSSPAGKYYGRVHSELVVTEKVSKCLLRMPFWLGLSIMQVRMVVSQLSGVLQG